MLRVIERGEGVEKINIISAILLQFIYLGEKGEWVVWQKERRRLWKEATVAGCSFIMK